MKYRALFLLLFYGLKDSSQKVLRNPPKASPLAREQRGSQHLTIWLISPWTGSPLCISSMLTHLGLSSRAGSLHLPWTIYVVFFLLSI